MGSNGIQVLAIAFATFWPTLSTAVDIKDEFATQDAIIEWAKGEFYGGHAVREFARDNKQVRIILGMPTSGMETTQVVVYRKVPTGWELLLFRNTLLGFVRVADTASGIRFHDYAGVEVLFIPWDGVPAP